MCPTSHHGRHDYSLMPDADSLSLEMQRKPVANDIGFFIGDVLTSCPLLRAIWRVGQLASGKADLSPAFVWDLIVFGDRPALQRLQEAAHIHRKDVRLCVVTDGDRFRSAWGIVQDGSLSRWEWAPANAGEAFYSASAAQAGHGDRVRYRAVRLWHAGRAEAVTAPQPTAYVAFPG